MGSGLSSSAALECAALGAFVTAAGWRIDRLEQARLAQRAENEYVGAPTGLLDQLSSLFGEESTALLIDFRKLTVEPVAFDPSASGVALLLIDSRERHGHVGGEYAARRCRVSGRPPMWVWCRCGRSRIVGFRCSTASPMRSMPVVPVMC